MSVYSSEFGLYKLRRKALPVLLRDQKFIVPTVYQETYSKDRFLIYDKRKTAYGGRLMILASDEQFNVLFHSNVYLIMALSKCLRNYLSSCMLSMVCKMEKV